MLKPIFDQIAKSVEHRNGAPHQGRSIFKRNLLSSLDAATAAPLINSVREAGGGAGVGNRVKARDRAIGGQDDSLVDMDEVADDLREARMGERVCGDAGGAMLHAGHRIEEMRKAAATASERLLRLCRTRDVRPTARGSPCGSAFR